MFGRCCAAWTTSKLLTVPRWWYSPLVPSDDSFPASCHQVLEASILSIATRLRQKRPADIFLEFTTGASSVIILFLDDVSAALALSPAVSANLAIVNYLQSHPDSNLASISNLKRQAQRLQLVASDILETFVDPELLRCTQVRLFLKQILAEVVLGVTLDRVSKADYINEWIVHLLEGAETETHVEDEKLDLGSETQHIKSRKEAVQAENQTHDGDFRNEDRKRAVSEAEAAMDEAMKEAQRLTRMMLEEDARKSAELNSDAHRPLLFSSESEDATSTSQAMTAAGVLVADEALPSQLATYDDATFATNSTGTVTEDALAQTNTQEPPPLPNRPAPTLSLRAASIAIFDDGIANDRKLLRTKPTGDYLIQVEPATAHYSGWITSRTYDEFSALHEILRRLSTVAGISFIPAHATLPSWKALAKDRLTGELERYLADALQFDELAESEGMKRFLDKERGLSQYSTKGTTWSTPAALESVGKGMLDVLSKAPKEVAGGGKALFGGVAGVLSGANPLATKRLSVNTTAVHRMNTLSSADQRQNSRQSSDLFRSPSEHELSRSITNVVAPGLSSSVTEPRRSSSSTRPLAQTSRSSSRLALSSLSQDDGMSGTERKQSIKTPPTRSSASMARLPPPPSEIADDYITSASRTQSYDQISHMSADGTSFFDVPTPSSSNTPLRSNSPTRPLSPPPPMPMNDALQPGPREDPTHVAHRPRSPLTTQEAQATVDVLFAATTQLFTLSSAWTFRRTLLAAAKTFLLRPGNPQLETLRALMQDSVVDAMTSESGIAAQMRSLMQSAMPTEAERSAWPPPRTPDEQEQLRQRARRLICERGMPTALSSVMGAAASAEALGKVFDVLQVEQVARGVVFAVMLQALKVVVQ